MGNKSNKSNLCFMSRKLLIIGINILTYLSNISFLEMLLYL